MSSLEPILQISRRYSFLALREQPNAADQDDDSGSHLQMRQIKGTIVRCLLQGSWHCGGMGHVIAAAADPDENSGPNLHLNTGFKLTDDHIVKKHQKCTIRDDFQLSVLFGGRIVVPVALVELSGCRGQAGVVTVHNFKVVPPNLAEAGEMVGYALVRQCTRLGPQSSRSPRHIAIMALAFQVHFPATAEALAASTSCKSLDTQGEAPTSLTQDVIAGTARDGAKYECALHSTYFKVQVGTAGMWRTWGFARNSHMALPCIAHA
ncbi:hypothetical protein C8R46DRAFT_1222152 [Mycena filopes]|nr:hypothetical protein C8R46DRAFT_1222152 [Mycena filopes]